MSMEKGKPIKGKTHYLQEPLRSCRLESISSSAPWGYTKGRKQRTSWKSVITVVGSSDSAPFHTAGNSSSWAGAWKFILQRNCKDRNPKFWDPRWSRNQWGLDLKTEELIKVWTLKNESVPRLFSLHPNLSRSGAFYSSCSQADKRPKTSLDKTTSPDDMHIWGNLNKVDSWTPCICVKLHICSFQWKTNIERKESISGNKDDDEEKSIKL